MKRYKLDRYDPNYFDENSKAIDCMAVDPDGDYVKYDEHAARIAELEVEVQRLHGIIESGLRLEQAVTQAKGGDDE